MLFRALPVCFTFTLRPEVEAGMVVSVKSHWVFSAGSVLPALTNTHTSSIILLPFSFIICCFICTLKRDLQPLHRFKVQEASTFICISAEI